MLDEFSDLCRKEEILSVKKSDCVGIEAWSGWVGVPAKFRTLPLRIPATVEPLEFSWSNLWRVFSSFGTNSDYPRGTQ
jgi:hypothetical protein